MASVGTFIGWVKDRFAEIKTKMAEEQTARLLEYAPKMLNLAYSERTFQNHTFNLADSYVWVVYYNGIPQGSGYLWNNRIATQDANFHHTKINGRSLASTFITRYVDRKSTRLNSSHSAKSRMPSSA